MQSGGSIEGGRFRYRLSPVNMRRAMWLVLAALGILILLPIVFVEDRNESILQALLEELLGLPGWALAGLVLGVVVLAMMMTRIAREAGEASLEIDAEGIRCRPHKHHGARSWTRRDWQVPWSAIQRAVVYRPGRKNHHIQSWMMTTLALETDSGEYALGLLNWDPAGEALDRPDLTALRPGRKLFELTESHPLVELLTQKGVPVDYPKSGVRAWRSLLKATKAARKSAEGEGPVDLLAWPSLVIMLGLTAIIAVTAGLHFTVLPPIRALWPAGYAQALLVGSVVFAAGALLSAKAPARERTVVALLLGVTVGVFWHPLNVRTQVMVRGETETVVYHAADPGQFRPVDTAYPQLDLADLDIPEYWNSLEPGGEHPFVLYRVGPERLVLSLDELFERTRAFYAALDTD